MTRYEAVDSYADKHVWRLYISSTPFDHWGINYLYDDKDGDDDDDGDRTEIRR